MQLELVALVGPQVEAEARLARVELLRRADRKEHLRPVDDAIASLVGEHHPVAADLRPEIGPALAPARAADLELVGEVGGELVLDPVVHLVHQEVGEGEPLDELVVHQLLAPQVEEIHRVREQPAEQRGGHRQVDLRGVLGRVLRGEHHRRPAGDGQLELAEEPGVLEVRALIARARREDVAQPPGHREQVPPLEDELLGAGRLRQLRQILVAEQLARRDGGQRPIAHVYPAYPASAAVKLSVATCRYSWR